MSFYKFQAIVINVKPHKQTKTETDINTIQYPSTTQEMCMKGGGTVPYFLQAFARVCVEPSANVRALTSWPPRDPSLHKPYKNINTIGIITKYQEIIAFVIEEENTERTRYN